MPRAYNRRPKPDFEPKTDFETKTDFESKTDFAQEPTVTHTDRISSVRIRTGGVHYSGARIVTLLTTDRNATSVLGSSVIQCEAIEFHSAGVRFVSAPHEGGQAHVVPYSAIEIVTLA
jgi:hypothetical protein